ncbi:hypothetical protein ABI59_16130 [Acidobacteria bacterium Mor1]|nr:hypothetical protein ABI59_16130 [Acidobacteria bacterium Mor1]
MTVTLRLAAPGLLLALAVLVPFLQKPFTIDDTLFLRMAEQALVEPLHPTAFDYLWDVYPQRVSTIMPSGPVGAWLLTPAVMLGGAEWAGHGVTLLLLLIGILATVSLGRRLGLDDNAARFGGLLLAATPAVLGMAGTCMPDVAAMTFGVLGLERLAAWFGRSREESSQSIHPWSRLLPGLICLSLSILARSHGLLLLGVAALLILRSRDGLQRPRVLQRLSLLLPVPFLAFAVFMLTRDPAGGAGVDDAVGGFFTLDVLRLNLFSFVTHYVLALPLVVPLWLARRSRVHWGTVLGGTLLAVHALDASRRLSEWWALAPLAGLGFAVLLHLVIDGWKQRAAPSEPGPLDGLARSALIVWLFVAAPVAVYLQLPAKYLVLSAPAFALLFVAEVRSPRLRIATLVYGVLLGVLILRADANLAGVQRQAVEQQLTPRLEQGQTIYFAGHWGFQWYAEEAGVEPLTDEFEPGDLVLLDPLAAGRNQLDFHVPEENRTLVELVPLGHPGGRLMSGGAGFYSNQWGLLPWAYSSEPIVTFELWRIDRITGD